MSLPIANGRKYYLRTFECTKCKQKIVIPLSGKQHKKGYLKPIWCINCKERTSHLQIDKGIKGQM